MNSKEAKRIAREAELKARRESEALARSLGQEAPVEVPETPEVKAEEPASPPPAPAPEPAKAETPAETLDAVIANLPASPIKDKLIAMAKAQAEEMEKLTAEKNLLERTKTQSLAWEGFKKRFNEVIFPTAVLPVLKEFGLDTASKRLVITFPDGKAVDRVEGGGSGGKREAPVRWGKGIVISEGGGKTAEYASPKAMAEALGLQVLHRATMEEVFNNPVKAYTDEEREAAGKDDKGVSLFKPVSLPKVYRIKEAIREKHFMVEVLPKPQ